MTLDHKLKIWLPVGDDDGYLSLEWMTDRELAVRAVEYLSKRKIACEASRETVEIISADYAGLPGIPKISGRGIQEK